MNFKGALIRLLMRPKIVHRLPGRLRIHIPLLRRVSPSQEAFMADFLTILMVPEPIEKADAHLSTGNVLIHYDQTRASEEEVVKFLKSLFKIFSKHIDSLLNLPEEKFPEVARRLKELIQTATQTRLVIDPNLEIPEDVLN